MLTIGPCSDNVLGAHPMRRMDDPPLSILMSFKKILRTKKPYFHVRLHPKCWYAPVSIILNTTPQQFAVLAFLFNACTAGGSLVHRLWFVPHVNSWQNHWTDTSLTKLIVIYTSLR